MTDLRERGAGSGTDTGGGDETRARWWQRVSPRTITLLVIAVVAVLVVGTYLVAFSPVFGAKTVEVRGEHRLSAASVREAARVPDGTPLVRLDTAAVAARVDKLADVAGTRVSVSYPNTVIITVTERVPVAYEIVDAHYRLVDATGRAYRVTPDKPSSLPRLVLGGTGAAAATTARAEATVAASLDRSVLAKIDSIQAFDANAITLLLHGNLVVHWGGSDRSGDKAQILPALLAQAAANGNTQIDVSNPDQPFLR